MPAIAMQAAKSRFGEGVDLTLSEGWQLVTRRGQDGVVSLSARAYRRMSWPEAPLLLATLLSSNPLRRISAAG